MLLRKSTLLSQGARRTCCSTRMCVHPTSWHATAFRAQSHWCAGTIQEDSPPADKTQEEIPSSKEDTRKAWLDSQKQLRAERIRQALEQGTLGLGFSAGGFLYGYHLGVLWELTRLKVLPPPGHSGALKMAGASAGSLAIATYACGLDVEVATQAMLSFAANCRAHGTRKRISALLEEFLHEHLPGDAHKRCEGLVHVALTRVFPVWTPELVNSFTSKSDLISSLVASCHIPVYANGDFMCKFRGKWYMDGGLTGFIPKPPDLHTVKVCCFPVSAFLEKVAHPRIEANAQVTSVLDVSISPDAFPSNDFQVPYPQLVQWALAPAEDDVLKHLVSKGRHDAHAWAVAVGLVPSSVESGKDVQPVPGEAAAEEDLRTGQGTGAELQAVKDV